MKKKIKTINVNVMSTEALCIAKTRAQTIKTMIEDTDDWDSHQVLEDITNDVLRLIRHIESIK